MLRNIYLYGELGQKFGQKWELDVESVREALWAIHTQTRNFLFAVREMDFGIVRGDELESGEQLNLDMTTINYPKGDFHICPVVEGAGFGDTWQFIVGGAALVAGIFLSSTPFGYPLIGLGVSMIAGGIAGLLAPVPETDSPNVIESYLHRGPHNRYAQGMPVPLGYGDYFSGSIVISQGIRTEEI